jgi:tRNA (cytidine32/uridine32-2'-O)-methyltransferase
MSQRVHLPIHDRVDFVLVRPHYPENLGACARALKTMGFHRLSLVRASRLAVPEHPMAFKMSVRAWDVLHTTTRHETLDAALAGADLVLATSSRSGLSGCLTAREAAELVNDEVARGRTARILFGNEKSGLSNEELERSHVRLRIPMAGEQPSINLAQAVQLVAYELYVTALARRQDAAEPER